MNLARTSQWKKLSLSYLKRIYYFYYPYLRGHDDITQAAAADRELICTWTLLPSGSFRRLCWCWNEETSKGIFERPGASGLGQIRQLNEKYGNRLKWINLNLKILIELSIQRLSRATSENEHNCFDLNVNCSSACLWAINIPLSTFGNFVCSQKWSHCRTYYANDCTRSK